MTTEQLLKQLNCDLQRVLKLKRTKENQQLINDMLTFKRELQAELR